MIARRDLPRLGLLWLAGIDLRLTILALPPVLPLVHADLDLSEKLVAALTGLPVLLFGMVAIPGSLLIARIGARRALLAALVVVAAGSACRGIGPSTPMLFVMTFVMGAGIAIMQPALPSLVSEWFRDAAGTATAVYANGLLIGEALAASLTLPVVLPLAGGSWELSFAIWAVPVLVTAALVARATRQHRDLPVEAGALWWPDVRDPDTWGLGLLLAGSSTVFFGVNAFIPDYLHASGASDLIGPCLTALNVGQLPSSLALMLLADRFTGRKAPLIWSGVGCLAGLPLFLIGTPAAEVAGAAVIGLAAAFALILTLALPPLLADPRGVHRLAGGMLAIGYLLAFILPLLSGVVWDATGSTASAFLPVVLGTAVLIAGAAMLRPHRPSQPAEARRGESKALR